MVGLDLGDLLGLLGGGAQEEGFPLRLSLEEVLADVEGLGDDLALRCDEGGHFEGEGLVVDGLEGSLGVEGRTGERWTRWTWLRWVSLR